MNFFFASIIRRDAMVCFVIWVLVFTYGLNDHCKPSPGIELPERAEADLIALKPKAISMLDEKVPETSGLIYFDGSFWTINDSGNENILYRIDSKSGSVLTEITVINAENVDWEELTQDEKHIYIADIGDNSLKRDEKQIYRLDKSEIIKVQVSGDLESEVIRFTYPDVEGKKVRFDAEALVSYNGVLHFFTKDFFETNHYTVSPKPGTTTAQFIENYKSNGQVTGAAMDSTNKILVMVGYLGFGQRLFWEFKDIDNGILSKAAIRHFSLGAVNETGQLEAVCFNADGEIFLSNESFGGLKQQLWNLPFPAK